MPVLQMSIRSRLPSRGVLAGLLLAGLSVVRAAPEPALAMKVLKAQCISCHNEEKHKGGLIMNSREALLKGGENGPAMVEGKPEESAMIKSLEASADPHMPPKKQLSTAQIAVLSEWVRAGASWDAAALAGQSPPRTVTLAALPAPVLAVTALAVSPDGTRLAAGWRNEVVIFEVTPKGPVEKARASAHPDAVQSIAWMPDGQRLVSGAFRRAVVWKAEPLAVERELAAGLAGRITAVRPLPDGAQVCLADELAAESGMIRVLDINAGTLTRAWTAHDDTVFALALNHDGTLLASAGGDKLVKFWNPSDGQETARLEAHSTQVLGLAFSPDGSQLVTAGADKALKVWDVKTRENTIALATKSAAFTSVAWSSEGPAVLAAGEDGALYRYTDLKAHTGAQSSDTGNERTLGRAAAAVNSVVTAGGFVFAGAADGSILSWDKDGKALEKWEGKREAAPASGPSFARDVLPVLAKAGCAAGACHAKAEGQNGFKLSVFSYDAKADYHGIVHGARGRRIFASDPAESLLLLKATHSLPHEGGERFSRDSEAYRTLAEWIKSGMPWQHPGEPALTKLEVTPAEHRSGKGVSAPLAVKAHYSDGSARDVTALADFSSNDKQVATVTDGGILTTGQVSGQAVIVARYMGLVEGAQVMVPSDALQPEEAYKDLPVNNFIDELAYARFRQMGLLPSAPCPDAEFLRRASLHTIGLLPTAEEARAFLADSAPDKRARAIDRLLAHPGYADHWAAKWADLLRPNPDRVGVKSVYLLDQWLREAFRANKPYDQFVREIVLTQGNTHRYGPAVIYRDRREPAELTTMFSQIFLGVRLECARCHHHPNEKWSQEDFFRMAAFFAPLQQKGGGISAPISGGNETFFVTAGRTLTHPVSGEVMPPRPPDGPAVSVPDGADPRGALASWMFDPANPFFAKAAANRVWAQFFGRGIVEPVDDFRLSNPASNPALLDALAAELIRVKYDLKSLMRVIMSSRLYQLSSEPNAANMADTRHFSRFYRRRLAAESMADAIAQVTGVHTAYTSLPPGSRAAQAWTYKIDSRTMDAFGRPNSSSDCPCERDLKPAIAQSLHLMNSDDLQAKLALTDAAATIEKLLAAKKEPRQMVEELYLACFTRLPAEEEMNIALAALTAAPDAPKQRQALEDVLWALINSAEFVFNH